MASVSRVVVVVALLALVAIPARGEAIGRGALSMLTELITVELSNHDRLSVLSSGDVREVVALEAERQAIGCEESASCLAEVAGAMGARFVMFGQLGRLGSVYILSLHLFDSDAATAAGRIVTKAASLEELAEKVEPTVSELVGKALEGMDEKVRIKILVLDLKPASGTLEEAEVAAEVEPPAPAPDSLPWLLVGGAAGAGVGGATLLAGITLGAVGFQTAAEGEQELVQLDAAQKREEANAWGTGANVAFVAGTLLLAGGAGVALVGLLLDGE